MAKAVSKTKATAKKFNVEKTAGKAVDTVVANPKSFLILAGVLVGGVALYRLSKVSGAVTDSVLEAIKNPEVKITLKEDLTKAPPTLTEVQVKNYATRLNAAMAQPGTDEQTIYDIFSKLSYNDFVRVEKAYSKKRYNPVTGEGSFFPAPAYDLLEWLAAELSPAEMQKLQNVAPHIFN